MLFKNKLLILAVLLSLVAFSPSNQGMSHNDSNYFSIQSNQKSNSVSGNISIIVYNLESYYTDNQISLIQNYVNNRLKPEFPEAKFNVTILNTVNDSNFVFANFLNQTFEETHPSYAFILGGIDNTQNSYLTNLKNWIAGKNYTYIKNLALVDSQKSNDELTKNLIPPSNEKIINNITIASYNLTQAGFMSGIKASLLTHTHKIGLIVDHSLQVSFNYGLSSPKDSNGFDIYSFNRADFVSGFIAGVEYSSEFFLNRTNINLKTESIGLQNYNPDQMANNVKSLSDFGADVIFNMESGLDNYFIQDANAFSIQTGVLGTNDTNATFSFVENTGPIIGNMLNQWNSSINMNDITYTLSNSSVISLSSMKDNRLLIAQSKILDGTIKVPSQIPVEEAPGFELLLSIMAVSLIIFKRKYLK